MRRGIDEPLEKPIEEPVDISKRLIEVRQEEETTRARLAELKNDSSIGEIPLVRASAAHRHALIVLDYWERKAAFEQQVFEIIVDNYVFHIIAALAICEVKRSKNSELYIE